EYTQGEACKVQPTSFVRGFELATVYEFATQCEEERVRHHQDDPNRDVNVHQIRHLTVLDVFDVLVKGKQLRQAIRPKEQTPQ
ncbi:unnamed protein product, partial [Aphanomyces euteiches]